MAQVPNIISTQAAGTNVSPLLDANFQACAGFSGASVVGNVATFSDTKGTIVNGGSLILPRSYLAGFVATNDATTPNSVLDIAAGQATDSTNATSISTSQTFYCSTGGAWVAGAGGAGAPVNKMGKSLTVGNSTWYHVIGITNGGVNDVYFDTSVTAANAPNGTTAFRRLCSFKTDGSAHILGFVQNGDEFLWNSPTTDVNGTATSATPSAVTLAAPLGVVTNALFVAELTSTGTTGINFYPVGLATQAFSPIFAISAAQIGGAYINMRTSTASQVMTVANNTNGLFYVSTYGWVDTRGRFN